MEIHRLMTVAQKEFSDHITGKKFIILLLMLSIAVAIGAFQGVVEYQEDLNQYKEGTGFYSDFPPSPINIFGNIAETIGYYGFGAVIAIALGFDLVAGEKETRSLKSLLSHPVYRDEIINGKAIGGILALIVTATAVFMLTYAILLLEGIVPDPSEIINIVIVWLATVLFLAANFSLALMASVIAKNSSSALILSLIILFTISFLIPVTGAKTACYIILGEEPPQVYGDEALSMSFEEKEWHDNNIKEYRKGESIIYSIFRLFSIQYNYSEIRRPLTNPSSYLRSISSTDTVIDPSEGITEMPEIIPLSEILEGIWANILLLFMFPVVFFGIAYVKFMRMDLR